MPEVTSRRAVFSPPLAPLLHALAQLRPRAGCIYRLELPVTGLDPLAVLAANPRYGKCYWQSEGNAFAGLGTALRIDTDCHRTLFRTLDEWLAQLRTPDGQAAEAYFFGGFSFNGRPGADHWRDFPAAGFVLPELVVEPERLAVHLVCDDHFADNHQRLIQRLGELDWQVPRLDTAPLRRLEHGSLDFTQWQDQVDQAMQAIGDRRLEKVVLSRRHAFTAGQAFDPYGLLHHWRQRNPDNATFLLARAGRQFVGSSPERLYRRRGETLTSDALAGTVARGNTPAQDDALARQLLHDPHLAHEHAIVSRFLVRQLAPLSQEVSVSPPDVKTLSTLQHRHQRVTARLKPTVDEARLIAALHPTPAVCGFPRDIARDYIARHEAGDRGWYAGGIGVYGRRKGEGASEFAVAIRSALIHGNTLDARVGAGLVAGADARSEWQELNAKLEALSEALHG